MSVVPQGKSVQALYRDYRTTALLVNRKYQRKLVWSLEEKQRLIDSILKGYPIPLILLARRSDAAPPERYEIIDGIQRLDAIFSFIENDFDLEGKYFDVDQFLTAKQFAENGAFVPQNSERLDADACATILDYQLAITVYAAENEEMITDVFGRINSGGRQLSFQEQRQAGVASIFAELVRRLAAEIRGDVSQEIVPLTDMPQISIESSRERLGYGITAEDTFWCRQGILSQSQLRSSEDEQTIADIVVSIVQGNPFAASREKLDELYNTANSSAQDFEKALVAYGPEQVQEEIKTTISHLKKVIHDCGDDRDLLRKTVRTHARHPIKLPFYAIFMAFWDLICRQNKYPGDSRAIMEALNGLSDQLQQMTKYQTTEGRTRNINLTKGLIQDHFVEDVAPSFGTGHQLLMDFENALRRSKIESARFECKQGILDLTPSREINRKLLTRLPKTACAIANVGPDRHGFIFLGVADTKNDADRIALLDHIEPSIVGDRYVVGIDREAKELGITVEHFVQKIVATFQSANLTENLKQQILSSFDCFQYKGLHVVSIRVPKQETMSFLDNRAYVRKGSSTMEVSGRDILAVQSLFQR